MAIITSSIGTSSRNYSTIALWEASLPASAVSAGNSYVGECYNDSEFNLGTTTTTFAGTTTDATHTITLTTAAGQSFRDAAGAASNALRYNLSNGVGITCAPAYGWSFSVTDSYVTISNLQIKQTASNGRGSIQFNGSTNAVVDSCIHWANGSRAENDVGVLDVFNCTGAIVKNNVIIVDSANAMVGLNVTVDATLVNNTVVKPTNRSAGGTPVLGIKTHYNSVTIQNNIVAGFGTDPCIGGNATKTGSGNATDATSYPSGLTGQVSLVMATEFENPSNASSVMDWRLKSTSVKCKDNGTNTGAPTTDIIGQAISNTTRDVGAWELQGGASSITGTLAATEATDTAAFIGSVIVSGTLAATGATDTAAFAGSVLTDITATLAVTEGIDTAAFVGSVIVSGTLAATGATDTAAFAGTVFTDITATLAVTEATDTAVFAGSVLISGTLTVTEFTDTAAFSGTVGVSGTLATTEGIDTAAFVGSVIVSGTLAATEGTDTAAFNGTVGNVIGATFAATEATDTAVFAGKLANMAALATTEATDTAAFVGSVIISGTLAATEATDTAAFVGSVVVSGTLARTESADTAAFVGSVVVSGTLAATESADTAAFSGTVTTTGLSGTLAVTEAKDTSVINGTVTGLVGSLAVTEATDTCIFNGNLGTSPIVGTLGVTEGSDTCSFSGVLVFEWIPIVPPDQIWIPVEASSTIWTPVV